MRQPIHLHAEFVTWESMAIKFVVRLLAPKPGIGVRQLVPRIAVSGLRRHLPASPFFGARQNSM
jgi:hypothetical protein